MNEDSQIWRSSNSHEDSTMSCVIALGRGVQRLNFTNARRCLCASVVRERPAEHRGPAP